MPHRGKTQGLRTWRAPSEVDDWDGECAKWKAGWRRDHCSEDHRSMTYEQYAGQVRYRNDYDPVWPDEQRTHLMMQRDNQRRVRRSVPLSGPRKNWRDGCVGD